MQLSHTSSAMSATSDDPNLVASAGLAPVLALAQRCGLHQTAADTLSVTNPNGALKTTAVVAGMVAGADSIDDMDRLPPVTARLIVRRVKLKPPAGQDVLVAGYRYHAVFTDSPMPMLQAETCHRGHAIIEQVMADLKNGPLAHLPSGRFAANAAWLTLAAIAHNLTRAAGTLASIFHATARPATIRDQLINVPARLATSARRLTMHLPSSWRWEHPWRTLAAAAT